MKSRFNEEIVNKDLTTIFLSVGSLRKQLKKFSSLHSYFNLSTYKPFKFVKI